VREGRFVSALFSQQHPLNAHLHHFHPHPGDVCRCGHAAH
jgi:hypothetical protein